jgi:hypothetical protein
MVRIFTSHPDFARHSSASERRRASPTTTRLPINFLVGELRRARPDFELRSGDFQSNKNHLTSGKALSSCGLFTYYAVRTEICIPDVHLT